MVIFFYSSYSLILEVVNGVRLSKTEITKLLILIVVSTSDWYNPIIYIYVYKNILYSSVTI